MNIFMGNALWAIIKQSDAITIGTLLILLVMSIVCWSIFIYKSLALRVKQRQVKVAMERSTSVKTTDDLLALSSQYSGTLPGYLLGQYFSLLKSLIVPEQTDKPLLKEVDWQIMQATIDQSVGDIIHNEESYMPVLSTSAAVATLLGLFGTVWGLIHAFVRIGQLQNADIATVAPGIAEALITTLAGLLVAIPALVMYHALMAQIRQLEHKLIIMTDRLNWVFYRLFVH